MNFLHSLQSVSEIGPPPAASESHYQTIGTLDQHFERIISK
jgi:hypothetical protein